MMLFSVLCVISEQTTFNKANQGITDITIHTIPGDTTVVQFSTNSISFVPANYFINLLSLDKIYLYRNVIANIADSAFSQVPTVTEINLSQNQLSVIREMMFSGLPNLARLRLNSNQIHTIQPGSFKDNMALTQLSFGDNSLETVSKSIFDPNNMNNHPTNLDDFYMNRNPLQCDNTICWLKQADKTWITVEYPSWTECAGPAGLAGRTWDALTEQDLCDMSG